MHSSLGQLEFARNICGRLMRQSLEELRVTPREVLVLRLLLLRGPSTVAVVRAATAMPASTVTSIALGLAGDGLVTRYRTTVDRRFVWLELTGRGRRVATMVEAAISDLEARLRASGSREPEALNGLADALHELTARRYADPLA